MIFITGDCHRNFERLNPSIFPEQGEMTKEDYVIICGDFGGIWEQDETDKQETMVLDWLECRPFTTLFVDGNHENFDRLNQYPVEWWNGGKVHKIRENVIHLMRGQVFELQGRTFFAFGGAKSHDIDGGILEPEDVDYQEKLEKLRQGSLPYRINHRTWWKEELPSEEEMEEGRKNLEAHDYKVDFIVTHCAPSTTQYLLGGTTYKSDDLTEYFEELFKKTQFCKWFFGHYHENENMTDKELVIYEQIIRVV